MQYEIIGGSFPAVKCHLAKGEVMKCEGGSMSWMDGGMKMSTEGGGGLGKALGRALSGENIFFNHYEATNDNSEIVFASSFPGVIMPVQLQPGQSIIAQRESFICSEKSVDVSTHYHKKIGSGLFGGMGFFLQKFTGPGFVFLEIDGGLEEVQLEAGEVKMIDGPHMAIMTEGVKFDIERIKGAKNMLLGGEGLFLTRVEGPGKVWLQTMPMSGVAGELAKYMPTQG